jgi:uncharacterized membrane protein
MTTNHPSPAPQAAGPSVSPAPPGPSFWAKVRTRMLEGLFVLLPILVTFWALLWLYLNLVKSVIDPVIAFVLWKARLIGSVDDLPVWFENYVAPLIAIVIILGTLYFFGMVAHTGFRRVLDKFFLRVPLVSQIYEGVQSMLACFDKPAGEISSQRMVLIPFPHAGAKLPAIVTSTSLDIATGRKLLCVYVPTTPVPASGFFLMIPEDETTELNWDVQQTIRAIISGGLTAPKEVSYFKAPSPVPHIGLPNVSQPGSPGVSSLS